MRITVLYLIITATLLMLTAGGDSIAALLATKAVAAVLGWSAYRLYRRWHSAGKLAELDKFLQE